MGQSGIFSLIDKQRVIHSIEVYSVTGERVFLVDEINTSSYELAKGKMVNGMYFYVLKTNDSEQAYSGKLLIQ